MDVQAEPDAPWVVRFTAWQQTHIAAFTVVVVVVTLVAVMTAGAAGFAAVSFLATALAMFAFWRTRAWLRRRIQEIVSDHGEIAARRVIILLGAHFRADAVRAEIESLVSVGRLDEADHGALRPTAYL